MNESSCNCCFGCFNRKGPDTVVFDAERWRVINGRMRSIDVGGRAEELEKVQLAYRLAREGSDPALFEVACGASGVDFEERVEAVRENPDKYKKFWITRKDDKAITRAEQYIKRWAPAPIALKWKICDARCVRRGETTGKPIVKGTIFTEKERIVLRKFDVDELWEIKDKARKAKLPLDLFIKLVQAASEAETEVGEVKFSGKFDLSRILDEESMRELEGACTIKQLARRFEAAKQMHRKLRRAKLEFVGDMLTGVKGVELKEDEFAALQQEFSKKESKEVKAEKRARRLSAHVLARLSKLADAESPVGF